MVGQNLDDPAVGDLAALALHDHALELPLEGLQARDPRLNKPELRAGYRIGGFAGLRRMIRQAEQLPDRVEREAELPPVSDEGQSVGVCGAIEPLVAARTLGFGQQPDLLVDRKSTRLNSSH